MLKNVRHMTNLNGESIINDTVVVYMSATIRSEGEISIDKSVRDWALYKENKTECNKDYSDFEAMVEEYAE